MTNKIVNVAVAVMHYQCQFLLGFRHASQHQGNRYEFIGGKIETFENPQQALIREVYEEIDCDISQNLLRKMGVIRHDYAEKTVALHIFAIAVSQAQFDSLQGGQGKEGQAITWVSKDALLNKKYSLPEANARILDWLCLPDTIFISQSLDKFEHEHAWVDYYVNHLPKNGYIYIRLQTDPQQAVPVIQAWQKKRNDTTSLIQYATFLALASDNNKIIHLNHQQLMGVDFAQLPKEPRYFASCHDKNSLSRINELAKTHRVMGCFLSPVNATPTHPKQGGIGWQAFGALADYSDVPVFALGGVGLADMSMAWQHNAMGVAGIRLLAPKPVI